MIDFGHICPLEAQKQPHPLTSLYALPFGRLGEADYRRENQAKRAFSTTTALSRVLVMLEHKPLLGLGLSLSLSVTQNNRLTLCV